MLITSYITPSKKISRKSVSSFSAGEWKFFCTTVTMTFINFSLPKRDFSCPSGLILYCLICFISMVVVSQDPMAAVAHRRPFRQRWILSPSARCK